MSKQFQVVGIGNSIVDILSTVTDQFLSDNGVEKGIMQLIDTDRAVELYAATGPSKEISGGSAANTVAGIAALGGKTAYIGKVKDDQLGQIFAHDLRAQGAVYETVMAPAGDGPETGRCIVLVSPDGERSMNTYLGWSEFLTPADIEPSKMTDAEWIFLEGYRFDGPDSQQAFADAVKTCTDAGGKASLTLSDPFCVERHRDAFLELIRSGISLLFANEHEMKSLYQVDDLEVALEKGRQDVEILACTVGEKGAYMIRGDERVHVPAEPTSVVDVTGAGDLFASGVLFGLTNGADLATAGRMGCVAAGEIISHIGARPEADLKKLFADKGLM